MTSGLLVYLFIILLLFLGLIACYYWIIIVLSSLGCYSRRSNYLPERDSTVQLLLLRPAGPQPSEPDHSARLPHTPLLNYKHLIHIYINIIYIHIIIQTNRTEPWRVVPGPVSAGNASGNKVFPITWLTLYYLSPRP